MFRTTLILSTTVTVVLMTLVVVRGATKSELPEGTIRSGAGRRKLHNLPFPHSHEFQQGFGTQTPTQIGDDYYTDDSAIDESMMENKKELFHNERHNGSGETDRSSAVAALDSQQGQSGSTGNSMPLVSLLVVCGINAFLASSYDFW